MNRFFRGTMLFWTIFIGVGAVGGAVGMLVAPDGSALGMQMMLPYFEVLPFADVLFQNYIFPGISLLLVNGLTNLTAFVLILKHKKAGAYLGCLFGITLMLWITIQFVIFPANFLSITYFIFGMLQFVCGGMYIIQTKQAEFAFDPASCSGIDPASDTLVIYYSRLGYTRKIALATANAISAATAEITTPERTQGFLGFAWLGRFAMHRWGLPIDALPVDPTSYQRVILVSPIHVFAVASPMREFCLRYQGRLKQVECVLVHFQKANFASAFDEVENLLQTKLGSKKSVVCRFGKIVRATCLTAQAATTATKE